MGLIKRRYVSTRLLQEGMVIDQSIIDRTGRALVQRKTALDNYIIQSLRKLGITGVYIREGEEDPEEKDIEIAPETRETIQKLTVPDRAKIQLSESVKKRVGTGVQYLFSNPQSDDFMSTADNISTDLMKAIMENDAIAVDIGTLKLSDEYTFQHSVDVASMAMIIARHHGLSQEDVYKIGITGLLHDVGKSQIPNEILNKPGKLTDEEFAVMKMHSIFGYNILKEKPDITPDILMGVLQHHEKLNAKGYPMGVTGDKICLFARILAVADIYDALVTERPYKKAFTQRDATEMIMAMSHELDLKAIQSFLESILLYPIGTVVSLSNGEKAKVVKNNEGYPLRPKVVALHSGKVYDLTQVGCASLIIE